MEPRELASEPISPELALVDPDLGARARAALPDHPWPAPVRYAPAPDVRAPRDGTPLLGTLWTLGFGLAIVLVIFGLSVIPAGDRPTFAAEGEPIPERSGRTHPDNRAKGTHAAHDAADAPCATADVPARAALLLGSAGWRGLLPDHLPAERQAALPDERGRCSGAAPGPRALHSRALPLDGATGDRHRCRRPPRRLDRRLHLPGRGRLTWRCAERT